MTVIPRFLAVLALLSAVLPAVDAHGKTPHCKPNEYYYERRGYCVAKNHYKNHAVDPPRGKGCPSHWYWSDAKDCCLPYSPPHNKWDNYVPTCPKGQKWDNKESYCHGPPSRGSNNPHPGNNNPHHGNDNPHHGNNNPHHGNDNPHHGNDNPHHGNDNPHYGNDNPHHSDDNPHYGGEPSRTDTGDTPPTGYQCPKGWRWDKGYGACVSLFDIHPPTICPDGWVWNDGRHRCQSESTPPSAYDPDPSHRGYIF
ncbi:hypothetical protein BC826DRAFT_1108155 [Russula brevipes]|nr:hypothetical protein BC826DRAFT_1108155 [Russula brevipes]